MSACLVRPHHDAPKQENPISCFKTRDERLKTVFCSNVLAFKNVTKYLVDPARCHMLVSKIKPCMSKNKPLYGESANGSLNQS